MKINEKERRIKELENMLKDRMKEIEENKKFIPEFITILGRRWKVEVNNLNNLDGKKVNGLCLYYSRTIKLESDNREILKTLFHEFTHALNYELGTAEKDKDYDEFKVRVVSRCWLDFFQSLILNHPKVKGGKT